MNQNGQYGNGQYNPGNQGMPYQNPGYQNQQYNTNNSQTGQEAGPDLRYQEPTFEQYCADPTAPRSFQALVSSAIKAKITGYLKSIPKMLLLMVPFTVLTFVFNVFFWSVLNDTMWAGSGTWGRISFMPYLIGGAVYSGSRYKGVTPFEIAGLTTTGKIVAPLTFALSLLFSRLVMRKKQGGNAAISKDFASVKGLRDHYEKALGVFPAPKAAKTNKPAAANMSYGQASPGMQSNPGMPNDQNMQYDQGNPNAAYNEAINNAVNNAKVMATTNGYIDLSNLGNNIYMRLGLCCAVLFGFIIRNPFAVPVFALLLYFSFGQGGQSDIGQTFFRIRSADGKLYDGRRQIPPRYSEGMLIMYYMSIGLFMYSAVNVVLWVLFNYNYYIRFVVSGALIAAVFKFGGSSKKQVAGTISSVLFIVGGFSLYCCVKVFADDNGWSESGRNLKGLIHNNGFPKAAWSSFLPGLFWSLGILLGWPLDLPFLPLDPGLMPPVPPVPPAPPVNPYDFEGRPQGWRLNDEGDISFTNPITGKSEKYGLTGYDENGKGIYIGENGSYYDQDELINNYNNALDHQEYFRDIHNTEQRNVAEQQAMNHAQWERERQTGETEASRLYKEDQERLKHEEYKEKLFEKYGTTDEKAIKKQIKQQQVKDGVEFDKQMSKDAVLGEMQNYAEKVEVVADVTINTLGEVTGPVGKTIKNVYNFTKPGMATLSTSLAEGKDGYDVFKDVALSVSESALNYAQGNSTGNLKIGLTVLKPALLNGAKTFTTEGKDGLDALQAFATGLTDGAFEVIKDNTSGATKFFTSIGTDTVKAGLDAYCKGEDVGAAFTRTLTESTLSNTAGAAYDYLSDKAFSTISSKLTADKTRQIGGIIDHQGKGGLNPKAHMANDPRSIDYLQKYNNQMIKVANNRLSEIKNIEGWTGAAKDLTKTLYDKTIGEKINSNIKDIGDIAVANRQTNNNNLFNAGQKMGMDYRNMTGYRKKP